MDMRTLNRRGFLMGAAAAAGAAYFAGGLGSGPAWAAQAQTGARKQVMVAGKPVKVIDIHAHLVVPQSEALLAGSNVKGDYPKNQILGPGRIAAMDARGIDMQVVSINQYWWYAAERDLAAKIVRVHDEGVADWCKGHSDRFVDRPRPPYSIPIWPPSSSNMP